MGRPRIRGALALLLALVAGCAAASPSAAKGQTGCIHHQEDQLASGPSTGTKPWTITAAIHNNGSCDRWFFEVGVSPFGTRAGSWRSGWSIPAGGSLPGKFRIAAADEAGDGREVFGGIVAARVSTIELTTSRGRHIEIHPKLPPKRLRHLAWLSNVRYFLRYYPGHQYAKTASLLASDGHLIYQAHRKEEGSFEGPCCFE